MYAYVRAFMCTRVRGSWWVCNIIIVGGIDDGSDTSGDIDGRGGGSNASGGDGWSCVLWYAAYVHSLTHSLTHSRIHLLTHARTHSITHAQTHIILQLSAQAQCDAQVHGGEGRQLGLLRGHAKPERGVHVCLRDLAVI